MAEQTPADAYIESCLIDLSKQLTAAQKRIVELEAVLARVACRCWPEPGCTHGARCKEFIARQAIGEKKYD